MPSEKIDVIPDLHRVYVLLKNEQDENSTFTILNRIRTRYEGIFKKIVKSDGKKKKNKQSFDIIAEDIIKTENLQEYVMEMKPIK